MNTRMRRGQKGCTVYYPCWPLWYIASLPRGLWQKFSVTYYNLLPKSSPKLKTQLWLTLKSPVSWIWYIIYAISMKWNRNWTSVHSEKLEELDNLTCPPIQNFTNRTTSSYRETCQDYCFVVFFQLIVNNRNCIKLHSGQLALTFIFMVKFIFVI